MRELALLMAAILALGYYTSGDRPAPDPAGPVPARHMGHGRTPRDAPGPRPEAGATGCRSEACRKMRLADPSYRPHAVRG